MGDLGTRLKIKYGLPNAPSSTEIERWAQLTQANIRNGVGREVAGESAAKLVFVGFRTHFYASEADTLEMLLQEALKK